MTLYGAPPGGQPYEAACYSDTFPKPELCTLGDGTYTVQVGSGERARAAKDCSALEPIAGSASLLQDDQPEEHRGRSAGVSGK